MSQKSVCVYCGSRNGTNPAYSDAAKQLGTALAQEGWRLVYGAGDVGLMGEVARATQSAGGETFGVIPQHLMQMEEQCLLLIMMAEDYQSSTFVKELLSFFV